MSRQNVELVRRAFGVMTIPGDPEATVAASQPDFEMQLVGVGGEPVRYTACAGSWTITRPSKPPGCANSRGF
jgi:hypothetical protein